MTSLFLRPARQLAQALTANDSPRQVAWGFVLGTFIGLVCIKVLSHNIQNNDHSSPMTILAWCGLGTAVVLMGAMYVHLHTPRIRRRNRLLNANEFVITQRGRNKIELSFKHVLEWKQLVTLENVNQVRIEAAESDNNDTLWCSEKQYALPLQGIRPADRKSIIETLLKNLHGQLASNKPD